MVGDRLTQSLQPSATPAPSNVLQPYWGELHLQPNEQVLDSILFESPSIATTLVAIAYSKILPHCDIGSKIYPKLGLI